MISSFDIAKLHSLLKDFYQLTKIRITVFDDSFRELTSYPDEIADFCKLIRQTPGCAMKCHLCDPMPVRLLRVVLLLILITVMPGLQRVSSRSVWETL